jgi:hypothetical protein
MFVFGNAVKEDEDYNDNKILEMKVHLARFSTSQASNNTKR